MKIFLGSADKPVRGAFLQLFEAKQVNGQGKPAYSGAFIIDPDNDQALIDFVTAKCEEVARAKWGEKAGPIITSLKLNNNLAIHNGDTKAEYDGYAGNFFINSRSETRPLVIDRDRSPLTAADGRVYSGCYVIAQVELWAQDNSFGKKVNAELKGVQFIRDGDAFGGGTGPASADDFGDLSVGSSDGGDLT